MTILSFNARKIDRLAHHKSPMLVVPVFTDHSLKGDLSAVDQQLGGVIEQTLALGDFSGELGSYAAMVGKGSLERLVLVGCGDASLFDRAAQRKLVGTVSAVVAKGKATAATVTLAHLAVGNDDLAFLLESIAKHTTLACYVYGDDHCRATESSA